MISFPKLQVRCGMAVLSAPLLLLVLLACSAPAATWASTLASDFGSCQSVVKTWAEAELASLERSRASRQGDPLQLRQLLFFLHIPRTGGRTYNQCFLRNLFANDQRCARSYDKLRIDTSAPNCRLLTTHDDHSLMSKLPENMTSVVTNMRHPLDRVISTYEFSVEVASRFLRVTGPYTFRQPVKKAVGNKRGVSTLEIWPWKYLVTLLQADVFHRRDAREKGVVVAQTVAENAYNVPSMVMPLQEFIEHPLAMDLVHNGATFQVAGLTNNSHLEEANSIRYCVREYPSLGRLVLDVAKEKLDDMLFVGLTEKHQESADMFATVVGGQVGPLSPPDPDVSFVKKMKSKGSWAGSLASDRTGTHQSDADSSGAGYSKQTLQQLETVEGEDTELTNSSLEEHKKFIAELLDTYTRCVANLRASQNSRRMATLELIKPANFSREHRRKIPKETIGDILRLNALDVELFDHAKDIFSKQQKVVNEPEFLEKRLELLEHGRIVQNGDPPEFYNHDLLSVSAEELLNSSTDYTSWVSVALISLAAFISGVFGYRSLRRRRVRDRSPLPHRHSLFSKARRPL